MSLRALYRRCQCLQIAAGWSLADLRAGSPVTASLELCHSPIHDIHAEFKRQPDPRNSVIDEPCLAKAPGWAPPRRSRQEAETK
jgi:hypothetical protein